MKQDTTQQQDTVTETDTAPVPDTAENNPNREAAKYRTRLREVEAERDTLATKVEQLQKQAVETMIQDRLRAPSAIWANGITVNDLLNDEGQLDPEKVKTATDEAVQELGLHEMPRTPRISAAQMLTEEQFPHAQDTMAEAIRG